MTKAFRNWKAFFFGRENCSAVLDSNEPLVPSKEPFMRHQVSRGQFWAAVAILPMALSSCVTNETIVKRMASRSTGCEQASIVVSEREQSFAGISHYETSGCGVTHNYRCEKWDNIVMASVGIINLDPRPCERERR